MKKLIVVAMVAASIPAFAPAVSAEEGDNASERRFCTQVSVRAGSRMSGRRICRTAAEWRQALGPDWRQMLTGRRAHEDYEALQARIGPYDDNGGQQGVPFSGSRARPGAGPN